MYVLNNYLLLIIKILSYKDPYMVYICEAFGCFCYESAMEFMSTLKGLEK